MENTGIWQDCPHCKGTGVEPNALMGTTFYPICKVCNGEKIISQITGKTPTQHTTTPSPSQVLTAEEILRKVGGGVISKSVAISAMQEFSDLQTKQLQNRVKELEGGLSGSIKVGEGTAITVGNYATICPYDGHNCYDSMCGRTTNICNNSHSFSKETILNDGDKDLIKQAHNEAIEACFKLIKRVGWLPDLEVFDGTALKIMEELEKEIKK